MECRKTFRILDKRQLYRKGKCTLVVIQIYPRGTFAEEIQFALFIWLMNEKSEVSLMKWELLVVECKLSKHTGNIVNF